LDKYVKEAFKHRIQSENEAFNHVITIYMYYTSFSDQIPYY